jgi:uncharacterized protein (TIGR03086 family)
VTTLDLKPATDALGALVAEVPDARLGAPTPCPDYTVGDLLDHIGGLAVAFTEAARKETGPGGAPPSPDAAHLGDDWRQRIPAQLDELAASWREPAAWTGMTAAGGVELPGEVAGLVALDEVVVHAWDLARACGFSLHTDPDLLEALHAFLLPMADAEPEPDGGLFGPPVEVPGDAPLLDRVLGLTGRDPRWTSPARH